MLKMKREKISSKNSWELNCTFCNENIYGKKTVRNIKQNFYRFVDTTFTQPVCEFTFQWVSKVKTRKENVS